MHASRDPGVPAPSGIGTRRHKRGKDLEITFDAVDHGFTAGNFAGKLLGKDTKGGLLIGYSRLPWVDYSFRPKGVNHQL